MGRLLLFLLPQSLSLLGSSAAQFGIIWTLTIRYSSGSVLFLSSLAGFVPQILLMLLSGSLSDSRGRRRVIVLSDAAAAFLALVLAAALGYGLDRLPVYLLILVGRSACSGLQSPAVESAVPLIAGNEMLQRANGMRGFLSASVALLSPAAAGALLPVCGLEGLLLLDAVTAAAAVAASLAVNIPERGVCGRAPIREVFSYLSSERRIRNLLVFHALALFLISPGAALSPLFVTREFGSSSALLSVSELSYSVGMVLGGLLISFSCRIRHRSRAVAFSLSVYGVMMFLMGLGVSFIPYLILNAAIGVVSPCYTALLNTEVQSIADEKMLGRVTSLFSLVSVSAVPAGLLVAAPCSDIVPVRLVFMAAGSLAVLHAALGGRYFVRGRA